MKKFKCQFSKDLSCEIEMPDKFPGQENYHPSVQWSGKTSAAVLRPYIAWMNSVNQIMADHWKAKLMHTYLITPSLGEVWVYEPGGRPKRVKV